ncbi:hypothetical protein AURDEDRAFT_175893 [Auricularia subglabra TFB-10046 SS5]|uniref:F-box domain-containing protein n=1 Tax=Auricularia subglabra (strain TFB-10046 / SS5) TaxID=717982 RepID=J0D7H6_AURST|nr:hypothetical protein AURDEDRAFT_175893 [Auricularia subglabra TFB-10046 SS5]
MSNASAVRQAIEELVKTTLASEMRPLNAALSLQNRLPNELWCLVWEALSAADRISVSLVCSRWRGLLYSFPRLCSPLLFYTTCHSAQCKCLGCTRTPSRYSDGDPAGWPIHSYNQASTNVAGAIGALSRSRKSPLHITFDIVPFKPNPVVVNSLIETLLSASWRLHTLVLRVCNPNDTASFLGRFDVLPALRVLDLDVVPANHSERRSRGHPFALRKIELPLLEELHLRSKQHEWYPDGPWMTGDPPSVESPMLRKLTVHFLLQFDDFIRILRKYPRLSHLSTTVPIKPDDGSPLLQELGALLRSAPLVDVEFFGIKVKDTLTWLDPTFEPLSLRRFVLGLDLWYASDTPWVFLNELGDAIHLSYSRTPTRQDLCGTDCTGRTRHLWSARNPKGRFLTGKFWLPWKRIVSLSVDATEWIAVLSRLHLWPVVENLRIAFSEEADIGSLPEDLARSIQFPRLRTVSITILADDVSVTATNVAASLRLLRLTAPLKCLSIDSRIEGYDEQLFTSFTQRVSIG